MPEQNLSCSEQIFVCRKNSLIYIPTILNVIRDAHHSFDHNHTLLPLASSRALIMHHFYPIVVSLILLAQATHGLTIRAAPAKAGAAATTPPTPAAAGSATGQCSGHRE